MSKEMKNKNELEYELGDFYIENENLIVETRLASIVIPNSNYWVEKDVDGDFTIVYDISKPEGEVEGEKSREILDEYEEYIDSCCAAIAQDIAKYFKDYYMGTGESHKAEEVRVIDREYYDYVGNNIASGTGESYLLLAEPINDYCITTYFKQD